MNEGKILAKVGNFTVSEKPITPKIEKKSEKVPQEPAQHTVPQKSANPETATAENFAPPKKPAQAASAAGGNAGEIWKRILGAAKNKLSPGVLPLFGGVSAAIDGNMLSLSSENAFVLQMLTRSENMDILRDVAAEVAPGIILSAGKKAEMPKNETSGIDELLSGLDDSVEVIIK